MKTLPVEFLSQQNLSVYEVPAQVLGEHVSAYMAQFGKILGASSDNLNVGEEFRIMINCKA